MKIISFDIECIIDNEDGTRYHLQSRQRHYTSFSSHGSYDDARTCLDLLGEDEETGKPYQKIIAEEYKFMDFTSKDYENVIDRLKIINLLK